MVFLNKARVNANPLHGIITPDLRKKTPSIPMAGRQNCPHRGQALNCGDIHGIVRPYSIPASQSRTRSHSRTWITRSPRGLEPDVEMTRQPGPRALVISVRSL